MDPYLGQAFDTLLHTSAQDLAERATHRAGGAAQALDALTQDPDGPLARRAEFTAAVFREQLLDSPAGACFVLQALAGRDLPGDPGGPAEAVLGRLARAAFADVVGRAASQELSRRLAFA